LVSALVGRLVPVLALCIPLLLVTMVAGTRRGLGAWPAALAAGIAFAAVQGRAANLVGPQLADVVAALAALAAVLWVNARFPPAAPFRFASDPPPSAAAPPPPARLLRAVSPFAMLAVAVAARSLPPARVLLERATLVLRVPGLDGALMQGGAPVPAVWKLDLLAAGGTAVAVAGLASALVCGAGAARSAGPSSPSHWCSGSPSS
jgi:lactate permease